MREKTRVPSKLPDTKKAKEVFETWFKTPTPTLNGKTPADLFRENGVEDCWIVGSCAWMPVVQGESHDGGSDIDVVLQHKSAIDDFVKYAVAMLKESSPDPDVRYLVEDGNLKNSVKVIKSWVAGNHREMRATVVNVWPLPKDVSIAEHVREYPLEHQRCAIEVATLIVTRLVKQDVDGYRSAQEYQRAQYRSTSYGS